MTARKKKTEAEKVPPPTDKVSRLSIHPSLRSRLRMVNKNPLDEALESEDVQMARDFKTMRVEEANMKRRVKMAKLQKEIDKLEKETDKTDSDDSYVPSISIGMAHQIANLPPEEREKVIETYAAFRSIDQSKGRGDALLPLLVGYSKTNPGTPQINMLDYAKAMSDQLKTGIDLMKSVAPPQDKPSNVLAFMKVFKDLVVEGVRNPLLQAIKETQPQPGVFEQILLNPDLRTAMKDIGMFGSNQPSTGSTNIDLEIEKLRSTNQLEITRLNLDVRKSMMEMEAKERRSDNIMASLAPFAAVLAGPAAQRMQHLGEQQGAAYRPPSGVPNVMPPTGTTILVQCSCGYEGPVTFPGPPPETVDCPSCGQMLNVGGPPNGKPEE